jgi:hypothetical protein
VSSLSGSAVTDIMMYEYVDRTFIVAKMIDENGRRLSYITVAFVS